jgi:hypothetical protein
LVIDDENDWLSMKWGNKEIKTLLRICKEKLEEGNVKGTIYTMYYIATKERRLWILYLENQMQ